jgi:Predicted ornithine cyclodeaminase, mu-crystallin homolog
MELRFLDEQEVLAALDRGAVREALRSAFAGLASGTTVQPAQTTIAFPDGAGDCIVYPGVIWDLDVVGVKVSPYISALAKAGRPPVTAYTILLSARTGRPRLVCDSLALTTVRTAATTALALEYLVRDSARTLAVVGAGAVAREHLRYILPQREWVSATVYSPSLNGDGERTAARRAQLSEFAVEIVESAQAAISDADVVLLCTSSGTPVIDLGWVKPEAVVTSITTNAPRAHEVAPSALQEFAVFCDYRQTAPGTAGEMVLAIESGAWSAERIVGDLPELVTGSARRPPTGRVFFRSTGLGIEDLAIASLIS